MRTEPNGPGTQHQHRYYRYATPLAALALLVSIASAVFTWRQATLIGEANEITKKNNVVSQRAFVSISLSGEFVSSETSGAPKALNFIISFVNSGNTPTKNLKLLARCAPSAEELQEPWSIIHQGPTPFGGEAPVFIGARASATTGCSFSWEKITQMRDGKLFGYLLSDVSYFDRLDPNVSHKTQMALRLEQIQIQPNSNAGAPPNIAHLSWAVGKHNCADEECPAD